MGAGRRSLRAVHGHQWERGPRNRETACHNWSFGPQIGDRWRKYRGRFQGVLGLSYKGSIPALPRPALGFTEQKESSRSAIFERDRYYLSRQSCPARISRLVLAELRIPGVALASRMPRETAEQPSVGAGSATHPAHSGHGRLAFWRQTAWRSGLGRPGFWRSRISALLRLALVALLLLPAGCDRLSPSRVQPGAEPPLKAEGPSGRLQEVAPPAAVQQLQAALVDRNPQVTILAPRDGAVLPGGPLTLQLQVRDWPLVDAGALGLGPHVVVQVDDQPPLPTTELKVELPALSPGSHRITAYAVRPWGEAVKNPGASDQIQVHRVAANPLAIPQPGTPQLLVVSPGALAGREPVLLDWLLIDAPLQGLRDNDGSWRLRVTVNGDSFLVDQNAPLWLKGWNRGSNSLLLELVDGRGEPLNPPFNSLVTELLLEPTAAGPIWQRGRLSPGDLAQLLGTAPPPEAPAAPSPPTKAEAPREETPEPTPEPQPEPQPEPLPAPAAAPEEQPVEEGVDQAVEQGVEQAVEPAVEPSEEPAEEPMAEEPIPEETEPSSASQPSSTPSSAAPPTNPDRIVPSSSVEGSARNQVNPDGSLLKPRPKGPLAGLRQKLGA